MPLITILLNVYRYFDGNFKINIYFAKYVNFFSISYRKNISGNATKVDLRYGLRHILLKIYVITYRFLLFIWLYMLYYFIFWP